MELPVLSTPRLILRAPRLADASWLHELAIDKEIRARTLQPARNWVSAWRDAVLTATVASPRWVIEEAVTGTPLGWILYSMLPPAESPAIGFEVRRAYWNRGYATEAVREVVRFSFLHTTERTLSGLVFVDNRPSPRVFEKAGFECKGPFRCQGRDTLLYETTAGSWRNGSASTADSA